MKLSRSLAALAVLATLGGTLPARAGMFDDNEARQAILDLRAQVKQLDERQQQLQNSLLDLNTQNEQLRRDLAALRGQQETLQRSASEADRRAAEAEQHAKAQAETASAAAAPVNVTVDGKTFAADPEQRRQFEAAMNQFGAGDFAGAAAAFNAFIQRNPDTPYKESALFWLGNARYAHREYKEAIWAFRALVTQYPQHAKAPEAQLSIANCQIEMKDTKAARRTLDDLQRQYPKSEAAATGRQRLATLK